MESCQNCAAPEGSLSHPGVRIALNLRPQGKYERERKQTVWCCNDECAVEALAIARYGPATHKWPITLAQFRAMNPVERRGPVSEKRARASRKAKDLIWGAPETMPTAKIGSSASLESTA